MPISAVDAINPAFRHTKAQLFQPFRFGQWVRLALVGLLAGELGGAGGCNFNLPVTHHEHGSQHFLDAPWLPQLTHHKAMFAIAVVIGIAVGLCIMLLFLYINSRMRFILFDSILAKECHIREGWTRRKREGLRFFEWQVWLMLLSFAGLIVLVGIPAAVVWSMGGFEHPKEHLVRLILGGVLVFLVIILFMLALAVVNVMTKDFVVPQMAFEEISAVEGWRRLWQALKSEKGGYAGYVGMKIVLAMGAGIAVGILTFIVIVALAIPIGSAGVALVLAAEAAGWTWNFYTIALAVVASCIAVAIFLFAILMVSVPIAVFFPAYAIYFFGGRYPHLAAVLWPSNPLPVAPGPAAPSLG